MPSRARAELRRLEREVLGAPAVPPGRVAGWANTVRRRLLGLHRTSAPPPLRVLEALFAPFDAHVLRVLVELDIPDALIEPTSTAELAESVGCEPARLERLVAYAAGRGLVGIDRRGRIAPNGVTEALRTGAPAPWRGWVRFATSDWFWAAWRQLGPSLRPGSAGAFELAHGAEFFDYTTAQEPAAGDAFDQAMAAGATLQAIGLARTLDWGEVASVCDVGGGTGAALDTLQRYRPNLEATLFDLPAVVTRSNFADHRTGALRHVVGGSFFDEIPPGHDRYLLLAIVHDWDDDNAVTILANVGEAMGPDGEAVVVETVLSGDARDDFAAASDLLMFVLASGRERTGDAYLQLFARAGLEVRRRHLLPTGSTAFVLGQRNAGDQPP